MNELREILTQVIKCTESEKLLIQVENDTNLHAIILSSNLLRTVMDCSPRNGKGTKFTNLLDPDKDLMFISSQIEVLKLGSCDLVRELIGDISSDDEEVDDKYFE